MGNKLIAHGRALRCCRPRYIRKGKIMGGAMTKSGKNEMMSRKDTIATAQAVRLNAALLFQKDGCGESDDAGNGCHEGIERPSYDLDEAVFEGE